MAEYTPVEHDDADFELESYDPPTYQTVTFELDPGDRLEAPVHTLAFDHPSATVQVSGTVTITAPTQTFGFDHPSATFDLQLTIDAPRQALGFDQPSAGIRVVFSLDAPIQTFELGTEQATIGFAEWAIDGDVLGTETGEVATHQLLTLSLRLDTDTLLENARATKTDENQITVLTTDDGGFNAIDRAGGSNTVELTPPITRRPLRQSGDYHVAEYEESLVSSDVGEWDVEIEFVRDADRTDEPDLSETPTGDEWGIDTRLGAIATDRVSADVVGTGSAGVERVELVLTLTFEQAHLLEASLARIDGARVREIADGTNRPTDDTPDSANTLVIDSPTPDVISSGEYVVVEPFESERLNESFNRVTLEIVPVVD